MFSHLFGQHFRVFVGVPYQESGSETCRKRSAHAWLINTGWSGGSTETGGERISLKYTRAIIDAIHDGSLIECKWEDEPIFGLTIPQACPNVPTEILNPINVWPEPSAFEKTAATLAEKFTENFQQYKDNVAPEVRNAGPRETR